MATNIYQLLLYMNIYPTELSQIVFITKYRCIRHVVINLSQRLIQ